MIERVVRGRRVVVGDELRAASVHVARGRIAAVSAWDDVPDGVPLDDVGDLVLMPGLVDSHVHINDPGRTDWEGFETATRAAASGGVTTIVDMPLNSIPATTSLAGLEAKVRATEGMLSVDVGLTGGAVPDNARELPAIWEAGVLAFKCFLADPGVPEFRELDAPGLALALRTLEPLGAALFVHAELPGPLDEAARVFGQVEGAAARRYVSWLQARPRAAENAAVALVAATVAETRARAHIVHLSSSDALEAIARARDDGLPLTAETCPHYLSFAAEEVPDGATEYKCAPPIRERDNREKLWSALRSGLVTQVVTDHSPSSPSVKCVDTGDFVRAWGGISSLGLGLPATWTGLRERGGSVTDLARWMCAAPAALVGLGGRKGVIAAGADADLVAWDPDAIFAVEPERLQQRHKLTPYARRSLSGVVRDVWLGGERIVDGGRLSDARRGRWIRRGAA